MSERQQLALIKRLEKANAARQEPEGGPSPGVNGLGGLNTASGTVAGGAADSMLASPPRAPLQVMTDANNQASTATTATSCSTSGSSSATDSPATPNNGANYGMGKINSPAVDRLLKKISKKNTKGETPLHTAAIRGSSRLVKQLLKMGADPNVQDNAEWSPLHEACNRGNLSVVKVLKEFGADLNLTGFGRDSPLHDAARNGHIKVVKFLVRSGVSLKAKNASNRTPREEAEMSRLRIQDNIDLDKTVTYLIERESARGNSLSDEVSSEFSENDEENNDIAKFLGMAKSPVVTQALHTLGLSSPSPRKRRKRSKSITPRKMSNGSVESSALPKVRLTYGQVDSTKNASEAKRINVKDNEKDTTKRAHENKVVDDDDDDDEEDKTKKVPPLKIVLSSRVLIEDIISDKVQSTVPNNRSSAPGTSSALPSSSLATSSSGNSVNEYYMKKRKLRAPPPVAVVHPLHVPENNRKKDCNPNNSQKIISESTTTVGQEDASEDASSSALPVKKRKSRWNDMEMYIQMRKQIEQKRKNMFPVCPKPPEGFKDYLMNKKTYLLQDNASERLRTMPLVQPPPSLKGPLRELFVFQEKERFKLRTKHVVEKEKLILAVEQEILRVHGRAARALANQTVPFSVCTILRDQDIYNPIDAGSQRTSVSGGLEPQNNMDKKDVRSRYNGRLFLSWLQDVDDKWEKIKEQMVLRHHNEAESLNAVQKLDWEWKLAELNNANHDSANNTVDDLYIPMLRVSDEFCLNVQ